MKTIRKQTIEATADGKDRANKRHKENLAFEAKKHKDNMILHQHALDIQAKVHEKMHEIEKEKMATTKEASEGFIYILLFISRAMAGLCVNS